MNFMVIFHSYVNVYQRVVLTMLWDEASVFLQMISYVYPYCYSLFPCFFKMIFLIEA